MRLIHIAACALLATSCSSQDAPTMIRVDGGPDARLAGDAQSDSGLDATADAGVADAAEICASDVDCSECAPCDLVRSRCVALNEARSCADGAGTCQDGVCLRRSCVVDGACDDGDLCNGVERCGPAGCQRGAALDCDDGDICTSDRCGRFVGGCVNDPLDADGDGHGPLFPGACGDDCHDGNARVFPGQTMYQSQPIDGFGPERDFDYNCDGVEEPLFDEGVGSCELVGRNCLLHPGFLDTVLACGESGFMLARCRTTRLPSGDLGCVKLPDASLRIQRCR